MMTMMTAPYGLSTILHEPYDLAGNVMASEGGYMSMANCLIDRRKRA